jgi:hypothetical protein
MQIPITRQNKPYPFLPWLLIIATLLWGLAATSAWGQGPDRTEADLERTDQVIEKATEAVVESGSKKGAALLQNARRFQEQARNHFRQHRYGQASQSTLKAREKAFEAIAATRSPEENENAVRRQLERTGEMLRDIQEKISSAPGGPGRSPGPGVDFLLRRQKTAWQYFHERRLRAALKLTLQVRERISRLTEQARRHRHGPANTERALKRLREFYDRVQGPVTESGLEKNIDMLKRAKRRLAQAEEALAKGQTSIAREHAKICRELLDRALAGTERAANRQEVAELMARAEGEWNRLEGAVIDSGDSELRDLHRRANIELQRAHSMIKAGKMARALAHARTAVKLLHDIEESLP